MFRTKALDLNRQLPIYRESEAPDVVAETMSISRAVSKAPTGMEKEEEEVGGEEGGSHAPSTSCVRRELLLRAVVGGKPHQVT